MHNGSMINLMTTTEVCDLLKISPQTLYAWRLRNEGPPAIKVGRHLRFREADVERWLNQRLAAAK